MTGSNPPTAPRLLGEPTILEHLDRSLTTAEEQEQLASETAQELIQIVGGLEKTFSDIAFIQLCEQHKITPLPTPPVLPSHAFQFLKKMMRRQKKSKNWHFPFSRPFLHQLYLLFKQNLKG